MKRTARDKTQDRPRPVERIELSEGNSRRKLILLCALLVISALAFGYALYHLLTPERGWTVIQVQESNTPHVGGDFVLQYDLTDAQYPAQTKRALPRRPTGSSIPLCPRRSSTIWPGSVPIPMRR